MVTSSFSVLYTVARLISGRRSWARLCTASAVRWTCSPSRTSATTRRWGVSRQSRSRRRCRRLLMAVILPVQIDCAVTGRLRKVLRVSATWIERWPLPPGDGPVVAVKDLIDVAGSPTTAGCRAVASVASPAGADAPCIERVRAAGGRLAGKTNLHELAYGTTGINPWYGTPANPADPGRAPRGSSSGS